MALELTAALLVTNVGPGPARLLEFEAKPEQGEVWGAPQLAIPSRLPGRERIELRLGQEPPPGDYPGARTLTVRSATGPWCASAVRDAGDALVARWTEGDAELLRFDADERSPAERRVHTNLLERTFGGHAVSGEPAA